MAKTQMTKDEFNGITLQSQWSPFISGSATLSYSTAGVTMTYPATTSATTDGDIAGVTGSLIDSYALLNVTAVQSASAVNSWFLFRMQITNTDLVAWRVQAGNLIAFKVVASVSTDLFTTAHSLITHAWLIIRENNGVTSWITSTDGVSWVVRYSEANPITLTAVLPLIAGLSSGVDASPGTIVWRMFNIKPAGVYLNNRTLRPHLFSPGLAR